MKKRLTFSQKSLAGGALKTAWILDSPFQIIYPTKMVAIYKNKTKTCLVCNGRPRFHALLLLVGVEVPVLNIFKDFVELIFFSRNCEIKS